MHKLYDLYNLCYGDKSNELFDELQINKYIKYEYKL